MKKSKIAGIVVLLLVIFGAIVIEPAVAGTKVVPVEGVSYNVKASMADNLKSLVGKKVAVTLASGQSLTGLVKDVGDHLVHIEKLEGNDFFDSLIRIDAINAISTQFRKVQR